MTPRAVAVLTALASTVALSGIAHGGGETQNYEQLQRTLEQKFAPQTRTIAPAAPPPASKDDFQWIEPEQKAAPPSPPAEPRRSSSTSWYAPIIDYFFPQGNLESAGKQAGTIAPASALRAREGSDESGASPLVQEVAQTEVPVAKKNSFVIQLKPSASEDDIKGLLSKYHLSITKMIAPLGVITVEHEEKAAEAEDSAGSEPAAADPKVKLQQILEPPLIRDIRQEGIVDGAFVNSTMGTKRLPRSSTAKVVFEDKSYSWQWQAGAGPDGNWGLKAMRMPPVWTILDRHRQLNAGHKRPKIGIVDGGFVESANVTFGSMIGLRPFSFHTASCETHHGMHVAGIIGAQSADGSGIDGMIPGARIDAVAVDDKIIGDSSEVGVDEGWEVHALLFDDVLAKTLDYVIANTVNPDNLRVVNISLGYNFLARELLGDTDPADVPGLALHILHQSNLIRLMASRVEKQVLFVVAAGNDSEGRAEPLDTRWASPFAWAGTQESSAGARPSNILVVEATGRDGARAGFSNTGGHVAAPGVGIMSTLAGGRDALGICSGTSQAAPHAAALAAILFELDSTKTPGEVAEILKSTAASAREGSKGAGRIDALDAVAALSPEMLRLAADLDGDGRVGETDMAIFVRQLDAIEAAATRNAAFTEDLNGDGVVDDNECHWPFIDFNGSGRAAATANDKRAMSGQKRGDVDILGIAWSDDAKPFDVALEEAGLAWRASEVLAASTGDDKSPPPQCRSVVPATGLVTASTEGRDAGATDRRETAGTRLAANADERPPSDPAEVRRDVEKAIEELKSKHPRLKVTINPATGLPSSITGLEPSPAPHSLGAARGKEMTEDETRQAVETYFGAGGLRSAFPTKNQKAVPTYTGRRRDPDFPGRFIAQVEQRVNGVLVFGSSGKLTVERSLGVTSYKGNTSNVALEDTTPKITEGEAKAAARAKLEEILRNAPDPSRAFPLGTGVEGDEAAPELVVFDPALVGETRKGPTRLAYSVKIDSYRIFVDAHTGEAFYSYRDQPYGMVRRIFDLGDGHVFPGAKSIDEEARERIEGLPPEALLAFRNAGLVRDYFFLVFGRDSYDDSDGTGPLGGGPLESYVRYGRAEAYWCVAKTSDCPKKNVMVYGRGYASALDIVAHEMTHGVLASEPYPLNYFNEAGAVNESLADIFGTLIEFEAKGAGANWLIGEGAPNFSVTQPLRSLSNPNLRDTSGKSMFNRNARYSLSNRGQPDHYSEVLTRDDELCASTVMQDNGCVHFNSGILNKFAYLISEGGEHHGVAVGGIGRYKLARIAYRAMTTGLNKSSGLIETATAFGIACSELAAYTVAGVVTDDCSQVYAAQRATGLGGAES